MSLLYFLGGQDPFREPLVEVMQRAVTEGGGHPHILVLPWGMAEAEGESKVAELDAAFRGLGAAGAMGATPQDDIHSLEKALISSDIVYLPDGDARSMQRAMRFSGMKKMLQDYQGIIIGDAMGGAVMCRHCLLPPDRYSSTYTMILGLNIVDFGIVPRYRREMDQYVVESSAGRTVFGIPEESALLYGAGMFSNHGKVFMIKHGIRTVLTEGRTPLPFLERPIVVWQLLFAAHRQHISCPNPLTLLRDALSRVREVGPSQRTLFNFDIEDPFEALSIDVFKDQFRRLNGRNPSAVELSTYYRKHPRELERRTGSFKKY